MDGVATEGARDDAGLGGGDLAGQLAALERRVLRSEQALEVIARSDSFKAAELRKLLAS